MIFTLVFWKAAGERSIRTFAQTAGATLAGGGVNLFDVSWEQSLSVGGLSALLSLLTSIGSAGVGPNGPGFFETTEPDARRNTEVL